MTRSQLEHIIRASGTIADDSDIVVVGSQAILGQFPDAPADLLISREADVYPLHYPDRADLIDGSIGEDSPFDAAFGFYAHGVGEETSVLPRCWRDRLVQVSNENTRGIRGWCLEVHDLAIAKHVAGREKDLDFTSSLVRHGMVNRKTLLDRLEITEISISAKEIIRARIES